MADNIYSSKYTGKQVDAAVAYYLDKSQSSELSYIYTSTIFCKSDSSIPALPFKQSSLPVSLPATPFNGLQDGKTWYDMMTSSDGTWYQCTIQINSNTKKVVAMGAVVQSSGGKDGKDGATGADGKTGDYTEFRYKRAKDTFAIVLTSAQKKSRYPSGWELSWENLTDGYDTQTLSDQIKTDFDSYVRRYSTQSSPSSNIYIWFNPGMAGSFSDINSVFQTIYGENLAVTDSVTQQLIVNCYNEFYTVLSNITVDRLGLCVGEYCKLHKKYIDSSAAYSTFQISAVIDGSTNSVKQEWSQPMKIDGDDGAVGPAGSNGIDGIAGVNIGIAYTIGNESGIMPSAKNPTTSPYNSNYEALFASGTGWYKEPQSVTTAYPYIWFTQCRYNTSTSGGVTVYTFEDTWCSPKRYSGLNGIDGAAGSVVKNPIIYPAGLFALDTSYVNDGNQTPYVYYEGNYYYLSSQGTYSSSVSTNNPNTSSMWTLMEGFEAVYAKVGIIANGLIGSAVFNGDYMFSQQGTDSGGNTSTAYQNFLKDYRTGATLTDPYSIYATFKPNICINFKTGEFWSNSVSTSISNSVSGISMSVKESINNTYKSAGVDISGGTVKVTGEFSGTASGSFDGDVSAKSFIIKDDSGFEVMKFTTYDSSMGSLTDGSSMADGTPIMLINFNGASWVTNLTKLQAASGSSINYIQEAMTTGAFYIASTVDKKTGTQGSKYSSITSAPYLKVRNGSNYTGQIIPATLVDPSGNSLSWSSVLSKVYSGSCPVVQDTANTDISNGKWQFILSGSFYTSSGTIYDGIPQTRTVAVTDSGYYYPVTCAYYRAITVNDGLVVYTGSGVLVGKSYTVQSGIQL